ncbi:unnamed protein product [Spirodela intermedia]|uniref:non-specific serine/threonine protein kinase n=1 Tax=Spirodela intermedia TaxID=51605 RepID=A0A7I8JFY9_SPIIN|nr:unnamed protein product [Spirodela intermedia]CAA6668665.1 unnamed protein product [Spirodela intermedia]
MENGSLWDWLHRPETEKKEMKKKMGRGLSWEERLRIAVGLVKGVEYLHYDCKERILHRDIKSSNVLLDGNMEAHLGDFGLAKVVAESRSTAGDGAGDSVGYTDSGSCFAGSFGYIAPEHAYSMRATEKSDVYSMGIVLMELVTGRTPTDPAFGEGPGIAGWARAAMNLRAMAMEEQLIDPTLRPLAAGEAAAMAEVLEVALECTAAAPPDRPTSREVASRLVRVEAGRGALGKKRTPQ